MSVFKPVFTEFLVVKRQKSRRLEVRSVPIIVCFPLRLTCRALIWTIRSHDVTRACRRKPLCTLGEPPEVFSRVTTRQIRELAPRRVFRWRLPLSVDIFARTRQVFRLHMRCSLSKQPRASEKTRNAAVAMMMEVFAKHC